MTTRSVICLQKKRLSEADQSAGHQDVSTDLVGRTHPNLLVVDQLAAPREGMEKMITGHLDVSTDLVGRTHPNLLVVYQLAAPREGMEKMITGHLDVSTDLVGRTHPNLLVVYQLAAPREGMEKMITVHLDVSTDLVGHAHPNLLVDQLVAPRKGMDPKNRLDPCHEQNLQMVRRIGTPGEMKRNDAHLQPLLLVLYRFLERIQGLLVRLMGIGTTPGEMKRNVAHLQPLLLVLYRFLERIQGLLVRLMGIGTNPGEMKRNDAHLQPLLLVLYRFLERIQGLLVRLIVTNRGIRTKSEIERRLRSLRRTREEMRNEADLPQCPSKGRERQEKIPKLHPVGLIVTNRGIRTK
mmetsp:Transcript_39401/g.95344  ORF Transcript_39401/g.95344 Transcript_39401/m.95344 type:complete len:351 (-) Transcript_39401:151-1203(-)